MQNDEAKTRRHITVSADMNVLTELCSTGRDVHRVHRTVHNNSPRTDHTKINGLHKNGSVIYIIYICNLVHSTYIQFYIYLEVVICTN